MAINTLARASENIGVRHPLKRHELTHFASLAGYVPNSNRFHLKIASLTNCPLDATLGSGKTVLSYTNGLRNLGHQCEAYTPEDFEAWRGLNKGKKFRQAYGAWRFVTRKLSVESYDIIEFYGDEFWLATSRLAGRQRRPLLVAHTNGLELLAAERQSAGCHSTSLRNRLYEMFSKQTHHRFSRMAFKKADAFVSLCELDRRYVLEAGLYGESRTAVVPPGLDDEYLARPFQSHEDERVAFTGSWIDRKGTSHLVTVITRLLKERGNLRFDVFGASGAAKQIRECFPDELHNRITVHARLTTAAIASKLSEAKVFFFPTQYEGFGLALAEAMACSCAAVTTPTGFGGELLHGHEALLCGFNEPEAMYLAVLSLLENEELRLEIARGGWQKVQALRWNKSVQKLEDVYLAWTKEHASRSIC